MAYSDTVLADSPWGFWPGVPSSGTLTDASPSGHNLTITGSSFSSITGPDGNPAVSWTGSYGNNGTILSSNTLQSVEWWVYLDALPTATVWLYTLGNGVNGSGGYSSGYINTDGTVAAQSWTTGNNVTTSPGPLSLQAWHHIVVTSSDLMRLYVDGSLVATGVAMGGNWTRYLYLPGTTSVKMAYPAYYYNLALSATQVSNHFAAMNLLRLSPVSSQATLTNQSVNLVLSAAGGTTPYTWSASNLPAGLSINASTGVISGTATTNGQNTVSISVSDATSKTVSTSFIWTVTSDTYACEVLSDSPLVYWRLDDASGTTMTDYSGYARNATYTGTPTLNQPSLLPATTDTSVYLSGSPYASIASAAWMNVSSALTLEAWVKPDGTGTGEIISRDNDGAGGGSSSFRIRSGTVFQFLLWHSGLTTLSSVTPVTPGMLYHVVATYDGTTAKLYLNGQLDSSVAATGAIVNSNRSTYVSALEGSSSERFAGYMDELAIYGSALSASQVLAHYTAAGFVNVVPPASQVTKPGQAANLTMTATGGATPYTWSATNLPTGLAIDSSTGVISGTATATGNFMPQITATDTRSTTSSVSFGWVVTSNYYTYAVLNDHPWSHWGFEETSGTLINDDQTTTRDGTAIGGVALNQPAGFVNSGLGAKLDGTSGYVSISNASTFLGLQTIEVLAEFDAIPSATNVVNPLFTNAIAAGQIIPLVLGFNLDNSHIGQLQAGYYTGSSWVTATSSVVPTVGQPYHIVATYDATNLKLWLNGANVASVAANNRPTTGAVNSTAYIGRRWDTAQFHNGKIWDVAVYGTALSSSQVSAHYLSAIDDQKPPAFSNVNAFPNNGALKLFYTLSQGYAVPVTINVTGDVTQTINDGSGQTGSFSLGGFTNGQAVNLTLTPSNTYGTGTAQNVSLTYTANTYDNTVQTDSAAVFYDSQEASGTTAFERVSGLNGTYQGTIVVNDTTDPAAPANLGQHVRLDGTSGYLQLAGGSWLTPANNGFSFEGNFYIRSWATWARIFDFAPAASTNDMYLAANSSTTLSLYVAGKAISFPLPPTGQWINLIATVDTTGNAVVYLDGSVCGSGQVGAPVNQYRANMYVGHSAYPADPYLAASLSHVMVYNSVLTPAQAANHAELALPYAGAQLNAITVESLNQVAYPSANLNAITAESLNQVSRPSAQLNAITVEAIIKYVPAFIGWGVPIGRKD